LGNNHGSREAYTPASALIDDARETDEIFTVLMGDGRRTRRKFIEDTRWM